MVDAGSTNLQDEVALWMDRNLPARVDLGRWDVVRVDGLFHGLRRGIDVRPVYSGHGGETHRRGCYAR